MTDTTEEATETTTETKDYQKLYEETEREKAAVLAKNAELLSEKRKAQQKAEEAEAEKAKLKDEKLLKDGKYEELYKSAEEQKRIYKEKMDAIDNERGRERVKVESLRLASQLADGVNAELLSEFIERRIKYSQDAFRVLDLNGGLTVSTLDDLKREFETSDRYKALLRGSKASGGNASGSGSGSSGTSSGQIVKRHVFQTWSAEKKMKFMTSGGKTEK